MREEFPRAGRPEAASAVGCEGGGALAAVGAYDGAKAWNPPVRLEKNSGSGWLPSPA